jgi:hypothetical protein
MARTPPRPASQPIRTSQRRKKDLVATVLGSPVKKSASNPRKTRQAVATSSSKSKDKAAKSKNTPENQTKVPTSSQVLQTNEGLQLANTHGSSESDNRCRASTQTANVPAVPIIGLRPLPAATKQKLLQSQSKAAPRPQLNPRPKLSNEKVKEIAEARAEKRHILGEAVDAVVHAHDEALDAAVECHRCVTGLYIT